MPQPFPKRSSGGYTIQHAPRIILKLPEHAAGIGLVSSSWASLERQLFTVFSIAMISSQQDGAAAERSYAIAECAWDAMESTRARLDFISNFVRKDLGQDEAREFTDVLVPEIQKRAAERNRVVHGDWGTCDEFPNDLILSGRSHEPNMRYSAKDFVEIADRIIATTGKVATYFILTVGKPEIPPEIIEQLAALKHGSSEDV